MSAASCTTLFVVTPDQLSSPSSPISSTSTSTSTSTAAASSPSGAVTNGTVDGNVTESKSEAPSAEDPVVELGLLKEYLITRGLLRRVPFDIAPSLSLQIVHKATANVVDPLVSPSPVSGTLSNGSSNKTKASNDKQHQQQQQLPLSPKSSSIPANPLQIPLTRVLFVVAGPGAGKKKHAARLASAGGYTYISAGALLQEEVKSKGPAADHIEKCLKAGELVSGEVICDLLEKALTKGVAEGSTRFVVEGFPRSQEHRSVWDKRAEGRVFTEGVVYLECPVDELRSRVTRRLESKENDSLYESETNVPTKFESFTSHLIPLVTALERDLLVARVDATGGDDIVQGLTRKALVGLGVPLSVANVETTFAMIKPDAVAKGYTDAIIQRINAAGFTILARETVTLSKEQATKFYAEHEGKSFFNNLINFMTSGPVVTLALRKLSAISDWRRLAGPTNSAKARVTSPASLRALFGTDGTMNAVHGSDSPLSANRELSLMFPNLAPTNLNKLPRGYHILLAGGPASGKGTQAEMLRERFGVVHISTGDLLREEKKRGTDLGMKAAEYFENGKLVPDDIMIPLVMTRLSRDDCKTKGWMLDGFPRTGGQAQALVKAGLTADVFVLIDVPDDVLIERVAGRRQDKNTGKIYHLKFNPPPPETKPEDLEQRADDTEEKIKGRIVSFKSNIDAIRDTFAPILAPIHGNRDKRAVFEDVLERIPSHL